MRNFLEKRRNRKLYEQWVSTDGLPPDEIPQELMSSESNIEEEGNTYESQKNLNYNGGQYISIKWRYIVYMGITILILVIIISVLATVLVMKS